MKKLLLAISCSLVLVPAIAQTIIADKTGKPSFPIEGLVICVDPNDDELVKQSAFLLQQDIKAVTGKAPEITNTLPNDRYILIGSLDKSGFIQSFAKKNAPRISGIKNKWETFHIQSFSNRMVIAGSDRRGTAFGVFELSRQLGVSPWYWWADVPVTQQSDINILRNIIVTDGPRVKYRGIFINDEAPALSRWSREKFGGFNHKFYEKVFQLILRLKGNYLWPAMWGNAFYDDDSLNRNMADKYGIVIGTSHHEPLMRAHDEWRRYGKGKWNYDSNAVQLQKFWREGMSRASNEKIVSVGMRGDGDEPMSRETATALLERIVADQRKIIADVTKKPADQTPQLWALYKEVQDYYDKGMRVPDDVTLLLCDDNWGNLRRVPLLNEKKRKGGYGIYYHFDYVGGPRNYKWLNTNPLPRIWEQMHLAWEYDARQIWIVNVGDIKPMELPISFFLDYAWNPEKIGSKDIKPYTEDWAARQFGKTYAKEIASMLATYAKYNARRKPELLDANTYNLANGEWKMVVDDYNNLLKQANQINDALPPNYRDAFFQLVLHPVKACANLNEMYYYVARNKEAAGRKWKEANDYAAKVKELYDRDTLITQEYHQLNNGKWNYMMSQAHIGYTYWQQPPRQKMPTVFFVAEDSIQPGREIGITDEASSIVPATVKGNAFFQREKTGVSILADHYTRAINSKNISWVVLEDHGRTGNAVTTMPVAIAELLPGKTSPILEYDIYTMGAGEVKINAYHSPSLNFQNTAEGLQYAISVDGAEPQIISLNKEDKNSISGIWNKWVAENIIITSSKHHLDKPGKHVIRYWMVNPGVVLEKLVVDFGDTGTYYLGPPETIYKTK